MRKLLVAFWLCGAAAGQALPGAADLKKTTPQSAGKVAKAPHSHRPPWHCIRRLGEMEVNLAVRLSSIGIRDSGLDNKFESAQGQALAGRRRPGMAPVEHLGAR